MPGFLLFFAVISGIAAYANFHNDRPGYAVACVFFLLCSIWAKARSTP